MAESNELQEGGVEVFDQGQARAIEWLRRDNNVAMFVSVISTEGVVDSLFLGQAPEGKLERLFLEGWFDALATTLEDRRDEVCGSD